MMKKRNKKQTKKRSGRCSDDALHTYLKEIRKIPLLSREEEAKIAREMANGDKKAREKLINSNLRFVIKIAKKYQGRGLPLEDLVNEGNIGLIKAVENFDVNRGIHFISYAIWWIRQSLVKAIAEKAKIIRMPMNWNIQLYQIEKARQIGKNHPLHGVELDQMSEKLKIEPERINDLIILGQEAISLDHPANDSEGMSPLGDLLESEIQPSPEEYTFKEILQNDIERVLKTLGSKEAEVIKARFGLTDGVPKTLEEIGDYFKISKEGVRQIETNALKQLRKPSRSRILQPYVA